MGYWFTIIGATLKLLDDLLLDLGLGSGESADFMQMLTTWLGFILSGIGIIKALIVGDGWTEKLKGVAIHIGLWILIFIGLVVVLPFLFLGVLIFVVDIFFLGGSISSFVHDKILVRFAGGDEDNEGESIWPITIYNVADLSKTFIIETNYGDKALYKNGDDSILISIDDVEDDHINTIYGTFKW